MGVEAPATSAAVVWHELECGGYRADLELWRMLAHEGDGAVLDLGSGTGRVATDLARRGHRVTAVDSDASLVAALRSRAKGLPVRALRADIRRFAVRDRFALAIAAMQVVQLLGGTARRRQMLANVARHLCPGGVLACALVEDLQPFEADRDGELTPDMCELGGTVYSSRPVAIRRDGGRLLLVRCRETVDPLGRRFSSEDVVALDRLSAARLESEGRAEGLRVLPSHVIAATDEHVGATVVMFSA